MTVVQPTRGRLAKSSPRYADWMRVFGTNVVELESPIAFRATLPGHGSVLVYKLLVASLSAEQKERLIAWMSIKFNRPFAEVTADVDGEHGVPILAADVFVAFDRRLVT